MTAPWNETTLLALLSNHELNEIFDTDEIGIFYQCLPNKTFHLSAEKSSGGKKSKVRLIGLASVYATHKKFQCLW